MCKRVSSPLQWLPIHFSPNSTSQVSQSLASAVSFIAIDAGRGTSAKIPGYSAIDDPHLSDYYARKFGKRAKSLQKRSYQKDALYRVTIKTANVKDAGTNAKVYLSIFGNRDKICRKLLTRETLLRSRTQLSLSLNGLDRLSDNDIFNVEFKRGATDILYIRCRDLGVIHHIILEVGRRYCLGYRSNNPIGSPLAHRPAVRTELAVRIHSSDQRSHRPIVSISMQ